MELDEVPVLGPGSQWQATFSAKPHLMMPYGALFRAILAEMHELYDLHRVASAGRTARLFAPGSVKLVNSGPNAYITPSILAGQPGPLVPSLTGRTFQTRSNRQ